MNIIGCDKNNMADYKYMPSKWSHSLSTSLKEIMVFNVLASKTS
jgi:hypothetical protein